DVVVGDGEPRPLVVALLRRDTVQPDVAGAEVGHPRPPGLEPVAPAPELGSDDVQAGEAERMVVGHAGDAGDDLAVKFTDEESPGVGRVEARAGVEHGIPPSAVSQVRIISISAGRIPRTMKFVSVVCISIPLKGMG